MALPLAQETPWLANPRKAGMGAGVGAGVGAGEAGPMPNSVTVRSKGYLVKATVAIVQDDRKRVSGTRWLTDKAECDSLYAARP